MRCECCDHLVGVDPGIALQAEEATWSIFISSASELSQVLSLPLLNPRGTSVGSQGQARGAPLLCEGISSSQRD